MRIGDPSQSPATRRDVAAGVRRPVATRLLERLSIAGFTPALAVTGLLLLTVAVFTRQLFGHWSFPWDFLGTYTATPPFVATTIGTGHPVSFSPFVAGGLPVDVYPQAEIYFPVWWLFGALGVPLTLGTLTSIQVAHVFIGSLGVLMLARVRRVAWAWATVAAVAYLFFGGFYGEAEHADYFRGFSYLPWLLWTLTPPTEDGRWIRLAALPVMAWLIASGAYPGQLASFGITGLVYAGLALRESGPVVWRRYRYALLLAACAAAAVSIAIVLPYLIADHAHDLYRPSPPTASVRAGESLSPLDLLGLYLNNFAWTFDGSVTAWAVTVPVLAGLAFVRLNVLRRQLPLVVFGAVALALAMTPRIGPVGKAMVATTQLFPSRFPAADYKAAVAIALVVLSADAWREFSNRRRGVVGAAVLAGCLLAGALLAPATYAQPTRHLWLVVAVIVATLLVAIVRVRPGVLVCLVIALIIVDGVREIHDYRLLGRLSPWQAPPSAVAPFRARDWYVRHLSVVLYQAVPTRPARVAAYLPINRAAEGSVQDSSGWIADGYHVSDYGGTVERVRWDAENNPVWSALMAKAWHAYVFPCASVGCSGGAVRLPPPLRWRPNPRVQTLSYGVHGIVYDVDVSQPVLMVENELALRGWQSNTSKARIVRAGIPLRTWRLSPGHYQFTASYHEPGRAPQELAAIIALVAWIACAVTLGRQATRRPEAAGPLA